MLSIMPFRRNHTSAELARQAERMMRNGQHARDIADRFRSALEKAVEEEARGGRPSGAFDYALKSSRHYEQAARGMASGVILMHMVSGDHLDAAVRLGEKAGNFENAAEMLEKALPLAKGAGEERDLLHRIGVLSNDAIAARRQANYVGELGTKPLTTARRVQA